MIDATDNFLNFTRRERAVFVVETVTGAVRRRNVKLYEVNVLAQDVCGRAYLKIVDVVIVGNEVRVPELDDVSRVSTEE